LNNFEEDNFRGKRKYFYSNRYVLSNLVIYYFSDSK